MEFEEFVKRMIFRIAVRFQNVLKINAPVDKGILRNSIVVRPTDDSLGLIIKMVEYGKEVEFGTNPHVIVPNTKKALAFGKGENRVVVKSVRHPGTRPNPFIRTSLRTELPRIVREELSKGVN